MVKWINSWAQGIIIAVIISTIIEMILPEGNSKKYIKTVIGVYIVFIIVSPIISKVTGKELNLKMYEMPETEKYNIATVDTNAYIESTYINNIKQEIIKSVKRKGYSVKNIEVEIETADENYGNINKINLKLEESKDINKNAIEPVEININNNTKEIKEITEDEKQELKEFLQSNYGTKIENINIE